MKLFRHLKEKRYLILAFTLPAILLALAIVFLQPAQNHAKVQVKVGTKQSSSSKPKASSKSSSSSSSSSSSTSSESSSSTVEAASQTEASSTPAVASAPTPSSAQEAYQAPQYNYVPPTAYTESHSDAPSYTAPAYSADVSSGTAE
ncbi:Wzz/FepE/Etk N-terminal domain-containing protein [uncultured Streptococcus sp.]|uniref:Wzz/FepE/Etk N-terminal domain-containing protein n=1 Tax=uncultured Streptococcus sp. TaxID=83427 RepID=UPI0025939C93|nr:Wzz/FepE/Etk N-terminal domain-containing protein [uncultured Streptococcus sp.]